LAEPTVGDDWESGLAGGALVVEAGTVWASSLDDAHPASRMQAAVMTSASREK